MISKKLWPLQSPFSITSTITTNPPFPSPFLVKLLAALCNIYWLIYKHEDTHLAFFFKCLMALLFPAQFSQRSFARLLSSVVLVRPGIRAIVFALVLQLMLLIRGCLMDRLGPWGAGSLMPFKIHSLTINVNLALAASEGCCLGIFPLEMGLISRGSRPITGGTFLFPGDWSYCIAAIIDLLCLTLVSSI